MDVLLILVPVALSLGAAFAFLFIRAAQTGQFEDLDDPAIRILQDDD